MLEAKTEKVVGVKETVRKIEARQKWDKVLVTTKIIRQAECITKVSALNVNFFCAD